MSEYKVVTQDYVNVQISTSKDDISFNEKRFQKGISVIDLKVFVMHIKNIYTHFIILF